MKLGNGIWTSLTLPLSACAPSVYAHGEPLPEPHSEARIEVTASPTSAVEPKEDVVAAPEPPLREAPHPLDPTSIPAEPADPIAAPIPVTANSARSSGEHVSGSPVKSAPAPAAAQVPTPAVAVLRNAKKPELWTLDRGEGKLPLLLQRSEKLVFDVHLNLAWLGNPIVGRVTMSSDVHP